jgi:RHS repeat-associated protein
VFVYVDVATSPLTIDRQDTGTGGISASGLTCPGGTTTQALPCGASYPLHTVVTLTPVPDPGSTFTGWSGACSGSGTCQVTMSGARPVAATFAKTPGTITTTYYHTDVVGSVRALTDQTGAVVLRHDYLPFGEDSQSMLGDPMRFAGKHLDPETALHYFEARYYRQTWGRFSQVDPLHVGAGLTDPQQWNRYAYARNNPLAYGDPTGMAVKNGGWTLTDNGWCHNSGIYCEFRDIAWDESPGFEASVGYGFGSDPGVIEGFGSGGAGGFFTLMDQTRHEKNPEHPDRTRPGLPKTPSTGDKKTDAEIATLHPSIRGQAAAVINDAKAELGLTLRITDGYRSMAEQDELYNRGRTTPGPRVTNARAGQSWHNYGLALDVVGIEEGRASYDLPWDDLARIGKRHGFDWGGDFKTISDKPHFEQTSGFRLLPR